MYYHPSDNLLSGEEHTGFHRKKRPHMQKNQVTFEKGAELSSVSRNAAGSIRAAGSRKNSEPPHAPDHREAALVRIPSSSKTELPEGAENPGIAAIRPKKTPKGSPAGNERKTKGTVRDRRLRMHQVRELLMAVSAGTETIIAAVDTELRFIFFNEAYREEIRRRTGKDPRLGTRVTDLFSHMPERKAAIAEEWRRPLSGECLTRIRESGDTAGYPRIYQVRHTPLRDAQGHITGATEVSYDITRQTRAEQGQRTTSTYLENLINYANAPILVWDPAFRITRFNRAFEHLTGRPAESVLGKSLDILFPETSRKASMDLIRKTLNGERWESVEIPILNLNGGVRIVLWNSATLYETDGVTVSSAIAQGQDITERKLAEEKNVTALKEKETLIREVHHRVKNNLQVISGLLDMTRMRISDETTTGILTDMMMKIRTMAQIHNRLYEARQFDRINFTAQVEDQVAAMSSIYAVGSRRISCEIESKPIFLTVDQAIPCALVVNEILSNSFKHAFAGRREGTIRIMMALENGRVRITIHDNGEGLPGDFDAERSNSLGLKLIRTLVRHQLQGTLGIISSGGTSLTVEFPLRQTEVKVNVTDTGS